MIVVDGVEVGRTDSAVNAVSARWSLDLAIALGAESELRFEVMDRDLTDDELIYTCAVTPDDALLASGMLACEQAFTTDTGRRSFAVRASIEPIVQ
jgi:hypothetical protein